MSCARAKSPQSLLRRAGVIQELVCRTPAQVLPSCASLLVGWFAYHIRRTQTSCTSNTPARWPSKLFRLLHQSDR